MEQEEAWHFSEIGSSTTRIPPASWRWMCTPPRANWNAFPHSFFKKEHQPDLAGQELLVLPVPFEVEPLTFAAGDMGVETMKRAMEDPSSPAISAIISRATR